jgi:hypothetical protein
MSDTLPGLEPERMTRDAQLSDDGVYRYSLTRRWGPGRHVTFVMLNPSTADALVDDPTIRRCIGFARSWDFSALRVVNLYALRSTDPGQLWDHPQPVGGPENDGAILDALRNGGLVIAAWGAHARPHRVAGFRALAAEVGVQVHALHVTKAGAPGHPLYLPASTQPTPYVFPDEIGALA